MDMNNEGTERTGREKGKWKRRGKREGRREV